MGKRPVSRGEAPSAFNSGGDEASFTSGVPHHTPPDLAVSAPLRATLKDRMMMMIRVEAADSSQYIYIYIYILGMCISITEADAIRISMHSQR